MGIFEESAATRTSRSSSRNCGNVLIEEKFTKSHWFLNPAFPPQSQLCCSLDFASCSLFLHFSPIVFCSRFSQFPAYPSTDRPTHPPQPSIGLRLGIGRFFENFLFSLLLEFSTIFLIWRNFTIIFAFSASFPYSLDSHDSWLQLRRPFFSFFLHPTRARILRFFYQLTQYTWVAVRA